MIRTPLVFGLAGLAVTLAAWQGSLMDQPVSAEPNPAAVISVAVLPEGALDPDTLAEQWIVTPEVGLALLEQGATLLDARNPDLKERDGYLPNSVAVRWQEFSEQEAPNKGQLLGDDDLLTQLLQEAGVSQDRPVVAMADPTQGWGEDGRIVWMLRTLGHEQAVLVDGGFPALREAGLDTVRDPIEPEPGDFVVARTDTWEINRDELRAALGSPNLVLIDAREPREYAGETPYGETRGGHVPGAIHVYYKDLLDEDGNLLSREAILDKLAGFGISPDARIVNYCTGGIRSGWFTSVLADLGFNTQNYAGSMWEWSAGDADQFPLER